MTNLGRCCYGGQVQVDNIFTSCPDLLHFFVVMIIIMLKGSIRDFLQTSHCTVNCLQCVHSSCKGAVVDNSYATHQWLLACHKTCAIWGNHFYLSLFSLAETINSFVTTTLCGDVSISAGKVKEQRHLQVHS